MKKFKLLSLVLCLLLSLSLLPASALALTDPEIGATAALIVDRDSGEIYYEKNADRRVVPASTTKMMTALLAVEALERGEISLSDSITAGETCLYNLDAESADCDPRLVPGEEISVQDLLYCTLLPSANEAANLLGQYVGGSIDGFVELMNARAEELGCTGTHYVNPNGMEDDDHYSTARDLSIIALEALQHSLFLDIVGTQKYTVPATNVADARSIVNTNSLLDPDSEFYYSKAYGVKTGYLEDAGYCLVSAAKQDDIDVVCVVMGGQALGDQFRDTMTLYDWLYDSYQYRQVLGSTESVVTVPVRMGASESVGARAEDAISVILPTDYDTSRIGYQYVLYHEANSDKLDAPVDAGQVLGEITVVEMDENNETIRTFGTSRLVAASSVEMSRREYLTSQVDDLFQEPVVRRIITILIVLLAIYVLLVAFYYIQRIRHLSSMRKAKRARAARLTDEEARWLKLPDVKNEEPSIEYFGKAETGGALPAREEVPPAPAESEEKAWTSEDVLEEARRMPSHGSGAEDAFDFGGEPAAPRKQAENSPLPKRRMPRNELADDEFFDSFFNR